MNLRDLSVSLNPSVTEASCHIRLLHGCWESKLKSSCLHRGHLTDRVISPVSLFPTLVCPPILYLPHTAHLTSYDLSVTYPQTLLSFSSYLVTFQPLLPVCSHVSVYSCGTHQRPLTHLQSPVPTHKHSHPEDDGTMKLCTLRTPRKTEDTHTHTHTLASDTRTKCSQGWKPVLTHRHTHETYTFTFTLVSTDTPIPCHAHHLHDSTLLFTPSCHADTLTGRFTPTHAGR